MDSKRLPPLPGSIGGFSEDEAGSTRRLQADAKEKFYSEMRNMHTKAAMNSPTPLVAPKRAGVVSSVNGDCDANDKSEAKLKGGYTQRLVR